MKELLQKLHDAAMQAILETEDVDSLESLRVKYLGKKGELTGILRQMGRLSAEERPAMGQLANQLRAEIEQTLETRRAALNEARLEMKLLQETVDVTLPGKKQPQGHKHPMYNVLDQIKDIFIGMGFEIVDGPEVELSDYNFTKLNIDEGHPSREWTDTFYFTDDSRICLRTQTSPMQIHAMETRPLPIRMIAPGRVYRKDEVDATHSPMFHQIEGMVIDKGVTRLPHLQGRGLDRGPGRRHGAPEGAGGLRHRPGRLLRLGLRHGPGAPGHGRVQDHGPASHLRERRAVPGAVLRRCRHESFQKMAQRVC